MESIFVSHSGPVTHNQIAKPHITQDYRERLKAPKIQKCFSLNQFYVRSIVKCIL